MKHFSLLLSVIFLFTATPIAQSQANAELPFPDLNFETNYVTAIQYAKSEGIVSGNSDGSFSPDRKISRQEFTKVLITSISSESDRRGYTDEACFDDLVSDWSYEYVCYAKDEEIIGGYSDGTFRPLENISFLEASKIILKAYGITFDESADDWYDEYLKTMEEKLMIPITVRKPNKHITRAEMVEVILRLKETENTYDSLTYNKDSEQFEYHLNQFDSCEDLESQIEIPVAMPYMRTMEMMSMDGSVSESAPVATSAKSGAANDFSQTNVQVKGIDEADTIKNNGSHIYMISGQEVLVVQAYPASNMETLTRIGFEDSFTPQTLYLDEKTLTVIGNSYETESISKQNSEIGDVNSSRIAADIMPPIFMGKNKTHIKSYAISNPQNPKLIRDTAFEGDMTHSRKKGEYIYVAIQNYPSWYGYEKGTARSMLPSIYESGKKQQSISCNDVHFTLPLETSSINTLIGLNVHDASEQADTYSIMSGSANMYMSHEHIYLTQTYYPMHMYKNVRGITPIGDLQKTALYKFDFDEGIISYASKGYAPGTIHNQFSMDEHDGFFRIATTTNQWWGKSANHVFVFDEEMEKVGKITNLAPDEVIYSVRFMGERGYIVTFKTVDPLFAIDLSNPYEPQVLGKLKIPGFSDYLHPYDENHLIGFGKDAAVISEDRAVNQGMKLAIFDVTDPTNPREIASESIGDRGTSSELLYNHKALLFDRSKNLLAFPVAVHEVPSSQKQDASTWGELTFQGAYIYDISIEDGFELEHKDTHTSQKDTIWDYTSKIQRIIYIGDVLYTISPKSIHAIDMNGYSLLKEHLLAS